MKTFMQIVIILVLLLITGIIWGISTVYLHQTKVELKGNIVGFDINIERTLVDDDMGLTSREKSFDDYAKFIEPNFRLDGLKDVTERIEERLLLEAKIFHELKNDAVIEGRDKGVDEDFEDFDDFDF